MAATPTPPEIVPTNLAIFRDVERPPFRVAAAAPATPVRSTTHPDESSFMACSDKGVGKTPYSSIEGSSPEVAVRAGR
eukprot:318904-Amphidinium_carterae.1